MHFVKVVRYTPQFPNHFKEQYNSLMGPSFLHNKSPFGEGAETSVFAKSLHLNIVFLFKYTMRAKMERMSRVTPPIAQPMIDFASIVIFWNILV